MNIIHYCIPRLFVCLFVFNSCFLSLNANNNAHKSKEGFVQKIHWPLEMELRKIVKFKKDTRAHMDATLAWMKEQDDFDEWAEPRKVYNNGHIGEYMYERNRSISKAYACHIISH